MNSGKNFGFYCFYVLAISFGTVKSFAGLPALQATCLDSSGQVKNIDEAVADKVCKATLSSCEQTQGDLKAEAAELVSWKIYGYYLGLKLDLAKSDIRCLKSNFPNAKSMPLADKLLAAKHLDGPSKGAPCLVQEDGAISPSLHKVALSCIPVIRPLAGSAKEMPAEISRENVKQKSCGADFVVRSNGRRHVEIFPLSDKLNSDVLNFILVPKTNAYLMGAYAMALQKAAYEVFVGPNALKSDLTNLSDVTRSLASNGSIIKDMTAMVSQYNDLSKKLAMEEEPLCNEPHSATEDACKVGNWVAGSPKIRICSLRASRVAFERGSIKNLLLLEVQARADKLFKDWFGGLAKPDGEDMAGFLLACGNNKFGTKALGTHNTGAKYSAIASCLSDGSLYRGISGGASKVRGNHTKYTCPVCAGALIQAAHLESRTKIPTIPNGPIEIRVIGEAGTIMSRRMKENRVVNRPVKINEYADRITVNKPYDSNDNAYSKNVGIAGYFEARIRGMCGQKAVNDANDCDRAELAGFKFIPRW